MDKENIKKIIKELSEQHDRIIAAPSAENKKLLDDIYPVEKICPNPTPEELKKLFDSRYKRALEIVEKVPPFIAESGSAIQLLYNEIRECTLFGVYGAAITLCGILVEFVLKYVSYYWDPLEVETSFDAVKWDKIVENTQFGDAIIQANKLGIINDIEASELRKFKDDVRNRYSHYKLRKLAENVMCGKVKKLDLNTGTVEEMDIPACSSPLFFSIAKSWLDNKLVSKVFFVTYHNVSILLERLNERQ
ncbi:MAG: hypothetical protein NTY95_19010, partial [Bacteroidia bacterium]|nr:hypothetical protein [Bacteroidia bacterium]